MKSHPCRILRSMLAPVDTIAFNLKNIYASARWLVRECRRVPGWRSAHVLTFIILASMLLASCNNPFTAPDYPRAVNGVLDLTAWDPAVTGSVPLMGEWKFIWNQDRPEFAGPGYPDAGWRTLTVPGYWNGISGTGKGYGWYRLRIKIHRERFAAGDRRLGISASLIQSAYEMYVDGNKVMSSGVFGRTGAESIPQLRPRVEQIDIPPIGDELVIAVRNSNFHHRSGGPYSIPEFGLYSELRRKEFHSDLIRLTVLGIIMMMGIYHMMLWLGRREDMASLYFFFGCLVVFLRLLATSGYLERIFPGLPMYELRFKIVYSSMPFVWMSFAYFFRELFREEFSGRLFKIFIFTGIAFAASILMLPCRVYSVISVMYEGMIVIIATWGFVNIIRATLRRKPGAIYIFPGFIALFITLVNDVLAVKLIINTPEIAPIGLVILILFQAAVLSKRFSTAFRTAEYLSDNLQKEVEIKTSELRLQTAAAIEANERLNSLYTLLKNDLGVARTIQDSLFPNGSRKIGELDCHARYLPLIEVGGDVYDACMTDDGNARFFIADATGHGINASLITMLIRGEYDMLKNKPLRPLEIITELNDRFHANYRAIMRLLTCSLIDINLREGTITHVSAGHPSQFLIRGDTIIELATTGRALVYNRETNCHESSIPYIKGDRLLLFTDGLVEQFDSNGEFFGESRTRKVIMENSDLPMNAIADKIINEIFTFTGGILNDDITAIGIE